MGVLFLLAAAVPQSAPVVSAGPATTQVLIDLVPGEVRCGEEVAAPVSLARPIPGTAIVQPQQTVAPFDLKFRIDERGQPIGIVAAPRDVRGVYVNPSDLQPALAASRFAPGAVREGCTIRYTAVVRPVIDAPIELVYRYLALPHDRSWFEPAIQERARTAGGTCFEGGAPNVLLRGFPDFDRIPQPPGALSMTMVAFDIDAAGKPTRIRTATSDGNAALDAAGRSAIAKSRFGAGSPRTGCTYPYYRRQQSPLRPPEMGSIDAFRPAGSGSGCDESEGRWALPPRMTFPEPFRRRGIEGWAVVRYDVAPWGQTGNVTVLASEPAAAFGDQARGIVAAAKRPPSERGASGCVERVVFKLPEGMKDEQSAVPPPPPPIID
jgi:TonB family protein